MFAGEENDELCGFQKNAPQSISLWSIVVQSDPAGGARNPSSVIPCADWLSLSDRLNVVFLEESGAVGVVAKFKKNEGSILVELNF